MKIRKPCFEIACVVILSILISLVSCKTSQHSKDNLGFYPIFDGQNLDGLEGDPKYWRIENGVLVGEVTPETILKNNSFIIYKKEQPENFEIKLEYRISDFGNSGINYRSEILANNPYALRGYQADIDGQNKYTGQNYEEKKRTTLAYRGEQVVINQMPESLDPNNLRSNVSKNCWQTRDVVASLKSKKSLESQIKNTDWNQVHLIVNGNRLQHYINGQLLSDVTDLDTINRTLKGYIGVQVHVGPPMKIEYRNMKLKHLKNDQ